MIAMPIEAELMTDSAALFKRFRKSDPIALVCACRIAFRVARNVLKNDADAEDVSQSAVTKALNQLKTHYEDRGEFKAWLHKVAYNEACSFRRTESARRHIAEPWPEHLQPSVPPADHAANELLKAIEMAVMNLGEDQRKLFADHLSGMTYRELAEKYGCSINAIRYRIHAICMELKQMLLNAGYSDDDLPFAG